MRIGGLASGIDTDNMIKELMNAERIPLDKLEQQKTKMEWQRDAFRDINNQIFEVERLIENMRLSSSRTINPKTTTSSMGNAVTATASADAGNGAYRIAVEQLATNAMNVSEISKINFQTELENFLGDKEEVTIAFYTYGEKVEEKDGKPEIPEGMQAREFTIKKGDTLESIAKKITDADDNVRAFYDENSGNFIIETTRSGIYNTTGKYGEAEIGFVTESEDPENNFFNAVLSMSQTDEIKAQNAVFHYNDEVRLESKDNHYTLNGITFNFHDVTDSSNAMITVAQDTDTAVDNITKFVTKYNELIESINDALGEPIYRDYPPLTDAQMEEMSDRQIELWDEKARSGLLRRDSILSSALDNLRSTWSMTADNDSVFRMMAEIGITTTENYLDGGQLEIDEELLREKLEEDAASVQNLLFNSAEGSSPGLLNRLENTLESTIDRIEERAGKGSSTTQGYTMGRQLEQMEDRIEAFENRLKQVEDRYWRQFSAMERAISMMNNQSAMLMSFSNPNM